MDANQKRWLTGMEKVLRIFCATLMLSLGFAHKPALAVAPEVVLDESYRLPDGTFAEICLGHAGGLNASHTKDSPTHSGDAILFCEACLLASSILLPMPDTEGWLKTQFAWLDNRLSAEWSFRSVLTIQQPAARGPPPQSA
ncbi:hypothetical protein G6L67_07340 [Agrobacterium tumefaciens]|jgi:hypothetical protein|nr:hypothetical protein ATCR1_01970 [Agrobacterium tumefaciens CCNWGS0286]KWT80476.1 hypothetical protein ASH09_04285 [Agrobacterium radiobacter]NTE66574.1 hypothetical protein [Agrobacterium tumefaciens]NIB09303.1 hypothetical protein [Agrobacterium radiobacter]NTE91666.1 hypothetical protein [Agrobacterium tumefaciens]